jgi:hypothetical protein
VHTDKQIRETSIPRQDQRGQNTCRSRKAISLEMEVSIYLPEADEWEEDIEEMELWLNAHKKDLSLWW